MTTLERGVPGALLNLTAVGGGIFGIDDGGVPGRLIASDGALLAIGGGWEVGGEGRAMVPGGVEDSTDDDVPNSPSPLEARLCVVIYCDKPLRAVWAPEG